MRAVAWGLLRTQSRKRGAALCNGGETGQNSLGSRRAHIPAAPRWRPPRSPARGPGAGLEVGPLKPTTLSRQRETQGGST